MAEAKIQIVMEGVDKTAGALNGISRRLDNVSNKLKAMRGPALAISGIMGALGVISVKSASDLGESINKAGLAFREAVGPVMKFAEGSAASIGIAQTEALDYTSVLGLIISKSGVTREESARLSIQMTKLAADIASVNNIPIADALLAIQSGLVGQAEPLRRYGVLLDEARVKTSALETGIIKEGEALTQGQKLQARINIIMEDTIDVQGDAINTAESFANATKRLVAQLRDLSAELGIILVPHLEEILKFMNDGIGVFSTLTDTAKILIFAVGGVSLALAGLILVLPFVISGITALAGVVGGLIAILGFFISPITLIAVAVGALAVAWHQNWFGMRKIVSEVLKVMDRHFTKFINSSIDGINLLIKGWNKFSEMTGWKDTIDEIDQIESGFALVGEAIDTVKEVGLSAFDKIKEELDAILFKTDLEIKGLGDWSAELENLRFQQEKLNKEMEKTAEIIDPDKETAKMVDVIANLQNRIDKFLMKGGTEAQVAPLRAQMKELAEKSGMAGLLSILSAGANFSPLFLWGDKEKSMLQIIKDLDATDRPSMQSGGIVPGSFGKPTAIIAHGGEEVIPAERVGSGNTIIVNAMSLGGDPLERRRVVEEIAAELGLLLAEEQRTR
jgi:hypothetical protein